MKPCPVLRLQHMLNALVRVPVLRQPQTIADAGASAQECYNPSATTTAATATTTARKAADAENADALRKATNAVSMGPLLK